MNKNIKNWIIKPIRATVFADRDAYYWIQSKLGLGNYQMAALVWAKGLIIGLLIGAFLLWAQTSTNQYIHWFCLILDNMKEELKLFS